MSLPHLLLVDDSEAILAFEKAALAGHYQISTATNGLEALQKVAQLKPDGLVLDLSMPEMDGDEVFARIQEDPVLREIPVVVVSSEKQRAEALVKIGAKAFLPKPIRADELSKVVGRVLDDAQRRARRGNMAVLFIGAGPIDMALPLDCIASVMLYPSTRPLPTGPSYLTSIVEVEGRPLCVLDLAVRLGTEHAEPIEHRKLVVVRKEVAEVALSVDRVRDAEEIPAGNVIPKDQLGGASMGPLQHTLIAVVKTSNGPVPILSPDALFSPKLLRELPALARAVPSLSREEHEPAAK